MFRLAIAALLLALLVACGGSPATPEPPAPPVDTQAQPGGSLNLEPVARAALACGTGTLAWAVVEATGGSVTQAGIYTAPACGASYADGTYHVQATGCGSSVSLPVAVAEAVTSVSVCGVVQGTSCCAASPSVAPGKTVQMYATVAMTCHSVATPSAPPAACP